MSDAIGPGPVKPADDEEFPEFTRSQKVFTLVGVLLGLLLAALDQTIVATAGPAIQTDLKIAPSLYAWLTTAYLIASSVMMPVYGKLSDLFGRKPIVITGVCVFLIGSFLSGIASSAFALILFRGIQGVGSAALITSALAVVADIFPPAERGKYQGILGAVFGISSVVGPLAGGFITDRFGWHWVFFVNLPIGAAALVFVITRMPVIGRRPRRLPLDYAGMLALVLTVIPMLLALSLGRSASQPPEGGWPWTSWQIISLAALALVGLVLFIVIERRAVDPLLDLQLFRNRTFAVASAAAFVVGASFLSAMVFLPLFMIHVVGVSATDSGLTLTPLTLALVAGNIASGQLVSRMGRYKTLMLCALVVLMAGFVFMGFTLSPDSTQSSVTFKMILIGLGLGPSIPLYTLVIQNAVHPRQLGVATGAATFFRQLGSTVGVALLGTVFGATLASQLATHMSEAAAEIPAAIRAELASAGAGTGSVDLEGSSSGQGFPARELKAQTRTRFARQREQVPAAVRGEAPDAALRLARLPELDPELRAALPGRGVARRAEAEFATLSVRIENAARTGNHRELAELARDGSVPRSLGATLLHLSEQPLATDEARRTAAAMLRGPLEAARQEAMTRAEERAISRIDHELDAAQVETIEAIDTMEHGYKQAFSVATARIYRVAVLIVTLALLITLALPELPLRRTHGPSPMAE